MMAYQEPVIGISKICDYGTLKCYNIECSCGSDDHALTLEIEKDDGMTDITINTYVTVTTDAWKEAINMSHVYKIDNVFLFEVCYFMVTMINSFIRKVSLSYDIWFHGISKFQTSLIMTKEQAMQYTATIEHAINDVENNNK